MSDLLSIGSSGVMAYQRALATVSNNIANVNTVGYTRQDSSITSNQPRLMGGSYLGTGASFDGVRRQFDAFVESNLRNSNSELQAQEPLLAYVNRLIDVMGDESIGLTTAMNLFFQSARDLASDPASTISRTIFLRDADGLAARFRQLAGQFDLLDNETRQSVQTDVGQVNSITQQLAFLNKQLSKHADLAKQPSELLDQRDLLLRKLSSLASIKTGFAPNGEVLVSLGDTSSQGFLVSKDESRDLVVGVDANGDIKINYRFPPTDPSTGLKLSLPPITSGKLGGVMNFREQVLAPALSAFDNLASVVANQVNAVHRTGIDAEGLLGGDLFAFSPGQDGRSGALYMIIQDASRVAAGGQFRVIDDPLNLGTAQARIDYAEPQYAGPTGLMGQLGSAQAPAIATESFPIGFGQSYATIGLVPQGMRDLVLTLDSSSAAQQFQVLTRDGRHLIGSDLGSLQQNLMNPSNGMQAGATYSNAYLNQSGSATYLGMDIFMGHKAEVVFQQQFNQLTGEALAPLAVAAQLRLNPAQLLPSVAGKLTLNGLEVPAGLDTAQDFVDWVNESQNQSLSKLQASVDAAGQIVLGRTEATAKTGDIRLGLGTAGTPADLAALGLSTQLYIKGGTPDDLLVYVTDSSGDFTQATVTAQFAGMDANAKQALRQSPLVVEFISDKAYRIRDANSNTVVAERSLNFVPGMPVPGIEYRGLRLDFSTLPKKGDVFTIDGNRDGIGNNETMLKLANLENQRLMPGGLTMTEAYIERVNQVGNVARQSAIAKQALTVVYDQALESRDAISGVSLDQEASALVRLQQAYQANAKVMQTAMSLFESILQVR
jgi:flagellar hook-associated protein 1 FlgK